MIIPEDVRVGSTIYKVELQSPIIQNGVACLGLCDMNNHTITLDNQIQDEQCMQITFLHELVHAMLFERQISLTGDYGLTYEQYEKLVDTFGFMFHQIIVDNPDIFITHEVTKNILSAYGVEIDDNGDVVERAVQSTLVTEL